MPRQSKLSAKQIAEYFIWKGQKQGRPVSNKKLQKLLYYAQAWSIVLRNEKLFSDKIEAWVHGPAVRSVYLAYKKFGFQPITESVNDIKLPIKVINFLEQVWRVYGKYDAAYLELLTHSEEPWIKAREGLAPDAGSMNVILTKDLKKFYSKKLKNS